MGWTVHIEQQHHSSLRPVWLCHWMFVSFDQQSDKNCTTHCYRNTADEVPGLDWAANVYTEPSHISITCCYGNGNQGKVAFYREMIVKLQLNWCQGQQERIRTGSLIEAHIVWSKLLNRTKNRTPNHMLSNNGLCLYAAYMCIHVTIFSTAWW